MTHLLISASHKSSGKTSISIGLCAALTQKNYIVQTFKKGPDYIDPLWLSEASKRPCHNLDFYTMENDEIIHTVKQYSYNSDINIIEGNKGLYDGLDLDGSNSNAALAKLLNIPVVLVLDARGMTRGIAPLILGYQNFDSKVKIAGVILNRLGGNRHEDKLRAVIEHYTDVKVLGAVYQDINLEIKERHLGLMPSNESIIATQQIDNLANAVTKQVDLEKIINIAVSSPALNKLPLIPNIKNINYKCKIGIIRDAAFGFYYTSDLTALEQAGAKLIFIDAINHKHLPKIDGLFIGGGFPEMHMEKLSANISLKNDIYQAIENYLPVYAECGGLMYLSKNITYLNKTCKMVGALPINTKVESTPQGRGYVHLQENNDNLWSNLSENNEFYAHEFHYSRVEKISKDIKLKFAYKILRGTGIDGQNDGIIYKNTLACYVHLRDVKKNHWTKRFINFILKVKNRT
jgi:cobyrinic acid a,c-diamide synthase